MCCRDLVHFREIPQLLRRPRHLLVPALLLLGAAAMDPGEPDIEALLDQAEAAERNGQLIYPASGSAMSIYHDVLFHDPDNEHARLGLIRLAEHYLEAAQVALQADQLLKADSLVSRARMIDPDYPAVASLQRQIDLLEQAELTRETLDWRLVANRSPTLADQLLRLGRLAKQGDCRVTIHVSNDAEGRWIYQNMNQASGTARLRAQVNIASPAAVDILCFNSPTGSDGRVATEAGSDVAVSEAPR